MKQERQGFRLVYLFIFLKKTTRTCGGRELADMWNMMEPWSHCRHFVCSQNQWEKKQGLEDEGGPKLLHQGAEKRL